MSQPDDLIKNILSDMKVELAEIFDKHFEQKAFFGDPWKPRKTPNRKGTLLVVTGNMRRSILPARRGNAVVFSSALPYTTVHNEGGKYLKHVRAHTRKRGSDKLHNVRAHTRTMNMPRRQFIGDHPEVRRATREIINKNTTDFFFQLARKLKQ